MISVNTDFARYNTQIVAVWSSNPFPEVRWHYTLWNYDFALRAFRKKVHCRQTNLIMLSHPLPLVECYTTNIFSRCVFDPLRHRYVYLRHSTLYAGGVRRSIPRCRGHERRRTALSDLQGCRILGYRHGLLGKHLLHHHRRLDALLHLQHILQHQRRITMEVMRARK